MDPHTITTATLVGASHLPFSAAFASQAADIVLIILLIALNGFFVAAEFSIVRVRATRIRTLATAGSMRAKVAEHILSRLDSYLSACQLGITICSVVLGAVGEHTVQITVVDPLFHLLGVDGKGVSAGLSFVLCTGIIVFLHVILGELAPKNFAIRSAESTALWTAYPLRVFSTLLYPLIALMNSSANLMLRLIGIQPASGHETAHSEEELLLILEQARRTGAVPDAKLALAERIFNFSDTYVRQVMVPRSEVAYFDLRKPLAENLEVAEQTVHSRYPLADGSLDRVVGVIHMKDLFWQMAEMDRQGQGITEGRLHPAIAGGDISKRPVTGADFMTAIGREVMFVPETMRLDSLLRDFQSRRVHLAMVVDEFGGVSGMVTFENVIEEIIGEVQDEFDMEMPLIKRLTPQEFMLDGITPLDQVNLALGTELASTEADTVGGFLSSELGRLPRPGERVQVENVEFVVREVRRLRVHRVLARKLESAVVPAAD